MKAPGSDGAGSPITSRDFWKTYWQTYVPTPVGRELFFSDLQAKFPGPGSTLIEIGGFPGDYSAYFHKYHGYRTKFIDFYIDPVVVRAVEKVNGIGEYSLQYLQGDFLFQNIQERFDVVFSAGFIEHFPDTEAMLRKHCALLKPGGTLLVTLPNFLGLNGWLQRWADPENYAAHNMRAMDLAFLGNILGDHGSNLGLQEASVFYHGKPRLWLDNPGKLPIALCKLIRFSSWLLRKTPFRGRVFAPYIVILGRN